MTARRRLLGRAAEGAAASWLAGGGWTVLARNWRSREGELDLVCRDPSGALVAVEVKCRTTGRAGSGLESVDRRRLARLRRALASYATAAPGAGGCGLRIDVIVVSPDEYGSWRLRRFAGIDAW